MTPEQRAEYESLDRAGRIKYTMRLKAEQAEAKGQKSPYGRQLARARKIKRDNVDACQAMKKTTDRQMAGVAPKAAGPSISDMRLAVQELLLEHKINPIAELLIMAKKKGKGALPLKDKKDIYKFLTPYIAPTLKAVDVQQESKMTVNVNIQSFSATSQKDLRAEVVDVDASEYDEFLNPEEDTSLLEEPESDE
jgi:hypothetical protein